MENSVPIKVDNITGLPQGILRSKIYRYDSILSINHFHSPLTNRVAIMGKRIVDLVLSSFFILTLLSWLIPLMALLIKLESKGSVFFLQKRYKRNGKLFTCIKFRTMIENREADILAAIENDHRITRIGRHLRKYHIDELPQLLNVWLGDMSIVGPRPYMPSDDHRFHQYMAQYELRYKVKPGMTGLAQSFGYHGVLQDVYKIKERTLLDLLYIKHWSLLMDMQIIYRTFRMLIRIGNRTKHPHSKKTAFKL